MMLKIKMFYVLSLPLLLLCSCISTSPLIDKHFQSRRLQRKEYLIYAGEKQIANMHPAIFGNLGNYIVELNQFVNKIIEEEQFDEENTKFYYYLNRFPIFRFNVPYVQIDNITFFSLPIVKYEIADPQLEDRLLFSMVVIDSNDSLSVFENYLKVSREKNEWRYSILDTLDRFKNMYQHWLDSKEHYFAKYCQKRLNLQVDVEPHFNATINEEKKNKYWQNFEKNKKKGDFEQCVSILFELAKADPQNGRIHFELGAILLDLDRIEESILAFQQAIEMDYKLGESYFFIGKAYFIRKWFDVSLKSFKKCVELDEYSLPAQIYMGKIFIYVGFKQKALMASRKLLEDYPNNFEIYYLRALIYNSLSEKELAIDNIKKAIDLHPDDAKLQDFYSHLTKDSGSQWSDGQ